MNLKKPANIYHRDREGNLTPISELRTGHLRNIIRMIERIADEGFTVKDGGGSSPDDYWYSEYEIAGQEALDHMNYDAYTTELQTRNQS